MKGANLFFLIAMLFIFSVNSNAQSYVSKVWVADNGNGTYKNPILHANYSNPDAIRVGNNYYLVSSSFEDIPGWPILHSKDLVNCTILTHALKRQPQVEHLKKKQHGNGFLAPSISFQKLGFTFTTPTPILIG